MILGGGGLVGGGGVHQKLDSDPEPLWLPKLRMEGKEWDVQPGRESAEDADGYCGIGIEIVPDPNIAKLTLQDPRN